MPIRESTDEKTGEQISEKFLNNFLADTEEEATKLYKEYEPIIKVIAAKTSMITGLDIDDLASEGTIGLARANRDFEETRGAAFKTFAIYKIKDAIREYSNSQNIDVNVPQYIKDAKILATSLKKLISYHDDEVLILKSLVDIWNTSKKYSDKNQASIKIDKKLLEDIISVKDRLKNLANRSCTSIIQLLERADLVPLKAISIVMDTKDIDIITKMSASDQKDDALTTLIKKDYIKILKEYLSEEDYKLLLDHYGEERTVRELAEEYDMKASSVHVRASQILNKVRRLRRKLFDYEDGDAV